VDCGRQAKHYNLVVDFFVDSLCTITLLLNVDTRCAKSCSCISSILCRTLTLILCKDQMRWVINALKQHYHIAFIGLQCYCRCNSQCCHLRESMAIEVAKCIVNVVYGSLEENLVQVNAI
jgi:hypothetical protein